MKDSFGRFLRICSGMAIVFVSKIILDLVNCPVWAEVLFGFYVLIECIKLIIQLSNEE